MAKVHWLKGRRRLAILFGILMFLLGTLLPVVTGIWSVAGSGNPITPVTNSLLQSSEFRNLAGQEFVRNLSKDATGEERDFFNKKSKDISRGVSNLLGQPAFNSELDKVSSQVYDFFVSGSKKSTFIEIKPIVNLALVALIQIDPKFTDLKKEIGKLKPIELKPQTSGPDILQIRKILNLIFFIILILFMLVNVLYFRYAKNVVGALRISGSQFIYMGALALLINIIGNSLVGNVVAKNSEALAKVAIPIVARQELGVFITLGLTGMFIGVVLQVISFSKSRNSKNLKAQLQ